MQIAQLTPVPLTIIAMSIVIIVALIMVRIGVIMVWIVTAVIGHISIAVPGIIDKIDRPAARIVAAAIIAPVLIVRWRHA